MFGFEELAHVTLPLISDLIADISRRARYSKPFRILDLRISKAAITCANMIYDDGINATDAFRSAKRRKHDVRRPADSVILSCKNRILAIRRRHHGRKLEELTIGELHQEDFSGRTDLDFPEPRRLKRSGKRLKDPVNFHKFVDELLVAISGFPNKTCGRDPTFKQACRIIKTCMAKKLIEMHHSWRDLMNESDVPLERIIDNMIRNDLLQPETWKTVAIPLDIGNYYRLNKET